MKMNTRELALPYISMHMFLFYYIICCCCCCCFFVINFYFRFSLLFFVVVNFGLKYYIVVSLVFLRLLTLHNTTLHSKYKNAIYLFIDIIYIYEIIIIIKADLRNDNNNNNKTTNLIM